MTDNNTPHVFISHASEDKDRFVLGFAERLRAKGINAWVDIWEVLPGDSLVDKMFNEGLKPADAVVVILSKFSVEKPWVQKEMTTAVIKNIDDRVRLIPIKIDDCEIPECLKTNLHLSIRDCNNYDSEFERIVSAIYGQFVKPPLGSRPLYADPEILQLDGLCRNDSLFLAESCHIALEQGHPSINPEHLVAKLAEKGMSEQDMMDAQEVLEGQYYIESSRTWGKPHVYNFHITTAGFQLFAEAGGMPDYDKKITDVARMIVEGVLVHGGMVSNTSIETELEMPVMLVEHILERLQDHGQIKYHTDRGGRLFMTVYWASPELRRKLEGNN